MLLGPPCIFCFKIMGLISRTVLKNKFVLKSTYEDFTKIVAFMIFFSYPGFFLGKNKSYEHSGVLLSTFQSRSRSRSLLFIEHLIYNQGCQSALQK